MAARKTKQPATKPPTEKTRKTKATENYYTAKGDKYLFEPPSRSHSGVYVGEYTSLSISAVWACVRLISETIAGLPIPVYLRTPTGKVPANDHPVYDLLNNTPNDFQDAFNVRAATVANALIYGNGYELLTRLAGGEVIARQPTDRITSEWDATKNAIVYRYDGQVMDSEDVLHLCGPMSLDGSIACPIVHYAREALGLAKATEVYGASFFGNNAKIGGTYKTPAGWTPDKQRAFTDALRNDHTGPEKAFKNQVLHDGASYDPGQSQSNEEGQFHETRSQQILEVCRFYNVPPPFIHDLQRATWSNLETLNTMFLQFGLLPWLKKLEQQYQRKLFLPSERNTYFAEHNVEGLLRADSAQRAAYYSTVVGQPIMTVAEARSKENLPHIDGTDRLEQNGSNNIPNPNQA